MQNGTSATPIIIPVNVTDNAKPQSLTGPGDPSHHIPGPPTSVILDANGHPTTSFSITELAGRTHAIDPDSVSVRVNWADVNPGDFPTASVKFGSLAYHNSAHVDVTSALSVQQLADIAAIELNLVPVPAAGNNNNGSATITYSLPDNAFDFLAAGESVTLTYLVDVHNNFAANDEVSHLSFTITIDGTNDVPMLAATSAAVAEHSGATDHAGGTITFTDVDLTDRPVVSTAFSSFNYKDAHGSDIALTPALQAEIAAVEAALTLNPSLANANTGTVTWSYDIADGLLGFLADGDQLTLTYMASVDDGHGGQVSTPITVTILGVSDVPFPIDERSNERGSNAPDTASGTLTFTGVDLNAIQSIGHSLISVTWSGGSVLPSGLVNTLDSSLTESVASKVGFEFSAADKTFDFLAVGETLAIIYDVTVTDSHGFTTTRPVTIIVTGTNDTPVITSETQAGAITELSHTPPPNPTGSTVFDTATGTVTFTDVDLNDHHLVSVTGVAASGVTSGLPGNSNVLGWLSLGELTDSTGTGTGGSDTWTFSAQDGNFDYLAAGETVTLTYTVQVNDGHGGVATQPVTITVTGTNDTPVITSGPQAGAITELFNTPQPNPTGSTAADTATGTVTFTDVDLSDHHTVSVTDVVASGTTSGLASPGDILGWLTFGALHDTTGSGTGGSDVWTFSAQDLSFDYLADGETLTLTYTVQVDDGHDGIVTQPVTITITGTNDTPTIVAGSTTASGGVTEDTNVVAGNVATSGTIEFQDVDLIDTHTATFALKSTTSSAHLPGFTDNTSNIGTFALAAVSEDNTDTTNTASLGWTFTLNDNNPVLQSLAVGETITQVYTVTVSDGHGGTVPQDVTVTITGVNDAPTIVAGSTTASGGVTEDTNVVAGNVATSGTIAFQDVDLTDTHTASFALKSSDATANLPGFTESTSNIGTFALAAVSEDNTDTTNTASLGWTFTLNDNNPVLQSLAVGQTITQVYTVTIDPTATAARRPQDVTITITGDNDDPTILALDHAVRWRHRRPDVDLAGNVGTSGTIAFQDVDLIDTHTATFVLKSSDATANLPGFAEASRSDIGTFAMAPR